MTLRSPSEQLVHFRSVARLLLEQAGDQEAELEALAAGVERDLRQAEAALLLEDVDDVRQLLTAQFRRTAAGAATARRLCVGARQQHAAAHRLLAQLGDGPADADRPNVVLVVDDYGEIRELLARVLQAAGFVVRTAANGLEGLIAAYEMRPRVIVMDVSMPVLDGLEATRLIKSCAAMREARVIAYTANPSVDQSQTRALFSAVLRKPASPEVVLALVQQTAGL